MVADGGWADVDEDAGADELCCRPFAAEPGMIRGAGAGGGCDDCRDDCRDGGDPALAVAGVAIVVLVGVVAVAAVAGVVVAAVVAAAVVAVVAAGAVPLRSPPAAPSVFNIVRRSIFGDVCVFLVQLRNAVSRYRVIALSLDLLLLLLLLLV